MELNLLIFIVIAILHLLFYLISAQDLETQEVKDFWMFIIFGIASLFMVLLNNDVDITHRTILIVETFAILLFSYFVGNSLYNKGLYGGADIKLVMALSPLIVSMGTLGVMYLLWFFGLNPLVDLLKRIFGNAQELQEAKKYPFIPLMSILFLVLFWLHLIVINN